MENPGLGVTGHGLLPAGGQKPGKVSPLENGVHDDDNKQSKTSRVGSSPSGNDEDMLGVEVVGQGLLRLDKQLEV